MKKLNLKSVMTVLMVLFSINAKAYDAEINGIFYNLDKEAKTAEVTFKDGSHLYSGDVEIPFSIESNGVSYSVISIGEYAFHQCVGLAFVDIPNSITSIGKHAFEGSGLKSITIPNSVKSIGYSAFANCIELASVIIPNSVTSIEYYAFEGCSGLTSITIPHSITSIGLGAFTGCSGLTSIIVDPDNTTYDSREDCNAIIETASNTLIVGCSKTIIPNNVSSIGGLAFCGCNGLASVTIPNSVTSIGDNAFCGCSALTSITIPCSVTSIDIAAFYGCSGLTSVTIPNSVTEIYKYTFQDCTSLKDIYCHVENVLDSPASAFEGVPITSVALHVPAISIEVYKSAECWKDFKEIVPLSEFEIVPMKEDTEVSFDKGVIKENDLTSTVIDNIYVTLDTDKNDGYDTGEKCIVLASTVTEEQLEVIADKKVQDEAVKENFNGLIFEVPAGKGTISINVQTKGSRILNVKIGDAEAQTFVQPERGDVEIPCTATENTYVYIYASATAASAQRRISGGETENGVLIYGIKWTQDESTNIDVVVTTDGATYQIYTPDGKPIETLQKGVNIIRYSDGQTKKVLVK